jgi:drug/metabolite transporter (DMT)-like permease
MTWAVAVILFKKSGETVHPIGLNLFKDLLALVLFLPTMWILGDSLFRSVPFQDYALLLFSGALGIGIADTLYLKSLNRLGAGLMSIVVCLYSPIIIVLSILYLGEQLSLWQLIGAGLIVSGVLAASLERQPNGLTRRQIVEGMIWGTLAQTTTGVSIVMVKPLLDRSPVLWVTEMRLIGGVIVLLIILGIHKRRREIIQSVRSKQRWVFTLSSSVMGAYLAMILWLGGMKYSQASVASALNQTASIFIFILALIFLKERVTLYRLIGIFLGMIGVMLITVL